MDTKYKVIRDTREQNGWTFMAGKACDGTVSGTLIGLLLCKGQQLYGWIPIANSIVKSLPVSIHSIDIIMSCLLTLGLAFIATIYPSSIAAKTSITESLRYE